MDGIVNIAKQQQVQTASKEIQENVVQEKQSKVQSTTEIVKQMAQNAEENGTKINSENDVKELVSQLNDALAPISTDIQFAVDKDNIFFVSIHEKGTHRFIRRFPAEKAADFLPKMREVTGVLFDTKG
jgi:flagellar protein FlaG